MFNLPEELRQRSWFIIDESVSGLTMNPMASFAMDDTLCEKVAAAESTGFARSWVHDKTVVLGIQDSRLPNIDAGVRYLKAQGYQVIVRNSGGLAVVLDPHVYNLSLLFPETRSLTIDLGYEAMVAFTRELLPELGDEIEDGEIPDSYCPGRFDLSVGGKKFAGISQRRLRGGVAVQIYLAMQGSGAARAELIRRFYDIATAEGEVKYTYPNINPETMASLTELIGTPLTNEVLTARITTALRKHSETFASYELHAEDDARFQYHLARMHKRNERFR